MAENCHLADLLGCQKPLELVARPDTEPVCLVLGMQGGFLQHAIARGLILRLRLQKQGKSSKLLIFLTP